MCLKEKPQSANNVAPSRKLLRNSLLPLFFSFSQSLIRSHPPHQPAHWMSYRFASGPWHTLPLCTHHLPHQTLPFTSTGVRMYAMCVCSLYLFMYAPCYSHCYFISRFCTYLCGTVVHSMVAINVICVSSRFWAAASISDRILGDALMQSFQHKYTLETKYTGGVTTQHAHTHRQKFILHNAHFEYGYLLSYSLTILSSLPFSLLA